jgi:hypothetical protein
MQWKGLRFCEELSHLTNNCASLLTQNLFQKVEAQVSILNQRLLILEPDPQSSEAIKAPVYNRCSRLKPWVSVPHVLKRLYSLANFCTCCDSKALGCQGLGLL